MINHQYLDLTFWASLWDLMKNKTNTWNNLAILCFGFAFSGFGTYFPKYLETVIKQNAANAALTTGIDNGAIICYFVFSVSFMKHAIQLLRCNSTTTCIVHINWHSLSPFQV